MEQKARPFTRAAMASATTMAAMRVNDTIMLATKLQMDSEREARLKAHKCKGCFYYSRLGGAAMTTRPCACCGKPQQYSSTATDALCADCAETHHLCKGCGGDLEMRTGRRNWPATPDNPQHP